MERVKAERDEALGILSEGQIKLVGGRSSYCSDFDFDYLTRQHSDTIERVVNQFCKRQAQLWSIEWQLGVRESKGYASLDFLAAVGEFKPDALNIKKRLADVAVKMGIRVAYHKSEDVRDCLCYSDSSDSDSDSSESPEEGEGDGPPQAWLEIGFPPQG